MVHGPPGGNITLHCKVSGVPLPMITWYRNISEGLKEINEEFYDNEFQELRLMDVRAEDEGVYICMAKNKLGTEKRNITLKLGKWGTWQASMFL